MTKFEATLVLSRCEACHNRFPPTDAPCPKCGSTRVSPYPVPDAGRVVAATELMAPAPGWTAPHRLALLDVADGVRMLAVVDGALPVPGSAVSVHLVGDVYHARTRPERADGRGEGESPKTRAHGSSFEPPR